MLRLHDHGDVLMLELASAGSRLVGYSVGAFVVRGGVGARGDVLVDTGCPRAWASLARWLDGHARGGGRLAGAVVTHHHEDHAGNVERLARRGVPLAMGAATAALVRAPAPVELYRRATWGRMPALRTAAPPFDPAPLALVPTPGHAADHHVVWDAARETVFAGDLFLGVKVRIAHDCEEPRALVASLRRVAALRPRRLFDAHRGPVDRPIAALEAKAEWLEDTIGTVERLLDAGWSDAAIRGRVLGREELTGWVSRGHYSRTGLVRAIRRNHAAARAA